MSPLQGAHNGARLGRSHVVGGEKMQTFITFTVFYTFTVLQDGVRCIPLADFYPFGEAVNETLLYRNDDGYSPPISLSSVFPFFDENYETVYVRNMHSYVARFQNS